MNHRDSLKEMAKRTTAALSKFSAGLNSVDNDTDDNHRKISELEINTVPDLLSKITGNTQNIATLRSDVDGLVVSYDAQLEAINSNHSALDTFVKTSGSVVLTSGLAATFTANSTTNAASSALTYALKNTLTSAESRITTLESLLSVDGSLTDIQNVIDFINTNSATLDAYAGTIQQLQTDVAGRALTGHVHASATEAEDGFLSKEDKAKINAIQPGAQVNPTITDSYTSSSTTTIPSSKALYGVYERTVNQAQSIAGKAPIEHVHETATSTSDGFLSKEDKAKLDSISEGAGVNNRLLTTTTELKTLDVETLAASVITGTLGKLLYNNITDVEDALDGKANSSHIHNEVSSTTSGFVSPTQKSTWDAKVGIEHAHGLKGIQVSTTTEADLKTKLITVRDPESPVRASDWMRVNDYLGPYSYGSTTSTILGISQKYLSELSIAIPIVRTSAWGYNTAYDTDGTPKDFMTSKNTQFTFKFLRQAYDGSPGAMTKLSIGSVTPKNGALTKSPPLCFGSFTRWTSSSSQYNYGTTVEVCIDTSVERYDIQAWVCDTGNNGRRIGFIDIMCVFPEIKTQYTPEYNNNGTKKGTLLAYEPYYGNGARDFYDPYNGVF